MQKVLQIKLRCDLTESEVGDRSQQLGESVIEQQQVEDEKQSVMKGYRQRLNEIRQRQFDLSAQIRNRSEFRLVDCAIRFDVPQLGYKRIVRTDTGEVVKEEPMTEEERQYKVFPEAAQ